MEALSALTAIGIFFAAVVISFAIALAPSIIAVKRKHKNKTAIIVTNIVGILFFGIGWFVALIWALTDNIEKV